MSGGRAPVAALAAWVLATVSGCAPEAPPDGASGSRPSFLLLSIDTLRADHLGCYGYGRDTSPRLDAFARDAIVYDQARAPSPWTLPSHAALFSGRHPRDLGIQDRAGSLPPDVPLLAERLATAGWDTAAFVDSKPGGFLAQRRGFGRGFDSYRHGPHPGARFANDMAATVDAGLGWLAGRPAQRPFFLFLHTKSVHATPQPGQPPYAKPEPYQSRFRPGAQPTTWPAQPGRSGSRTLTELNLALATGAAGPGALAPERMEELGATYDGGIAYMDEQLGRLLEGLRDLGLEDDTVVVVLSDHGEAFGEHRFVGHMEVYDALLRVPLIVRDPDGPAPGRVAWPVELADLFGSILARAGLPPGEGTTARPLPGWVGPAPTNGGGDRFHYFHLDAQHPYEAYALRDGAWKLVWHRTRAQAGFVAELYDTRADPHEQHPLTDQPRRLGAMLARLRAWVEDPDRAAARRIDLSEAELEELRALGYGH